MLEPIDKAVILTNHRDAWGGNVGQPTSVASTIGSLAGGGSMQIDQILADRQVKLIRCTYPWVAKRANAGLSHRTQ
jgi:hypothetical protein